MNLSISLPEDVIDQIAREEAHFVLAPAAFFHAWKRGVEIAGVEWFGNGTREGFLNATCGFHDTWTLSPRSFGHSFHAHLDT